MSTVGVATWEMYLRSQFPAYLLPESAAEKLSEQEATRFLAALVGKSNAFTILRNASFLAPRMTDLLGFVGRVQQFVRSLPSKTETVERQWIGGFQGKLDLRATTMLHLQGRRTEFVTRTPQRHFDLSENIVLRDVCARIVRLLTDLRLASTLPEKGWGMGGRECEGSLRHVLATSALRHVSSYSSDARDVMAARVSRQPLFREAARWHDELRAGLENEDPVQVARTVAEGALLPLEAPTRFEIAVAMKLIASVHEMLDASAPGEWVHERGLVISGRKDIATLRCGDVSVRFFYNQAELGIGPVDLGIQHYFASSSRMRPDVTVAVWRGDALVNALVVECKHSTSRDYLVTGFKEAMLYRHEYGAVLRGPVKSVLVASSAVPGMPRAGDEVIAVTWEEWPPSGVVSSVTDSALY